MENALKNLFAVSDLRNRILFTLALLGVYRIGNHIPLDYFTQGFPVAVHAVEVRPPVGRPAVCVDRGVQVDTPC